MADGGWRDMGGYAGYILPKNMVGMGDCVLQIVFCMRMAGCGLRVFAAREQIRTKNGLM